jgi:hypothetical protein
MKKWRLGILLAVLLLAFLASTVAAIGSTNYLLNWFNPMTMGSADHMSSTNYQLVVSVGQTGVATTLDSTNYKLALGFYPGLHFSFWNFLPVTLRQ